MLVVSNTSPISNLAIIALLDFLPRRYGLVRIPFAVADELSALTHAVGGQRIKAAFSDRWLIAERVENGFFRPLPFPLDRGRDGGHRARLTTQSRCFADGRKTRTRSGPA
jgi:predicted nucleic acid-binding protein